MSHNTMAAWFSGTDNGDDRNSIRFSGVFGKLDQPEAMTVWRFNYMDKKFPATIADIFEEPIKPQQDVPAEWLGKIKVQTMAPALRVTSTPNAKWTPNTPAYGYTQSQLNYARRQRAMAKHNLDDFNGDFWGFNEASAYDSLYGSMESEIKEADTVKGKPSPKFYDLDDPEDVKEIRGEYVPEAPVGEPLEEYEQLAKDFGPDAADAFWDINQCIVQLEGSDDLLNSVVEEACGMMKDSHAKLKAMRAIYESLDQRSRDNLANNGM